MSFANLPGATFLPTRNHRFLSELFSSTYKSLVPQLHCLHIYTKRRGVPPPDFQDPYGFRDIPDYPPSFHAFRDSLAQLQNSTPLFSRKSTLFSQNTGGGGLRKPRLGITRASQLRPAAPRLASRLPGWRSNPNRLRAAACALSCPASQRQGLQRNRAAHPPESAREFPSPCRSLPGRLARPSCAEPPAPSRCPN